VTSNAPPLSGKRSHSRLREFFWMTAILLPLIVLSDLTGFSQWVDETPTANAVYRGGAALLFAGLGLAIFFSRNPMLRQLGYRLLGAFLMLASASHIALLMTGETSLVDIFARASA
jgi:hypothetical protein